MASFVLFTAASQTFALPATCALQVLRMAAPTPVPGAPPHVRGVLDVHGMLVPVVDVAARLGAQVRPPRAEDQLLVVEIAGRRVALEVERVLEIREVPDAAVSPYPEWIAPDPLAAGLVRLPQGTVVIQALEEWLRGVEPAAR
ncbi:MULTISPECIES: chemotaxis protein CheW [Anaeromyxobacter]|uniref:chemotaxis protein CheW n=1 Tax=Anaeromyxobacter TaxID=161492 RepID=UPI001F59D620|nr:MULTISPECIES: chemotaxis protein CheW [unclassified Anaeromyxobacter]